MLVLRMKYDVRQWVVLGFPFSSELLFICVKTYINANANVRFVLQCGLDVINVLKGMGDEDFGIPSSQKKHCIHYHQYFLFS